MLLKQSKRRNESGIEREREIARVDQFFQGRSQLLKAFYFYAHVHPHTSAESQHKA